MPVTKNNRLGPSNEECIELRTNTAPPAPQGAIKYNGTSFQMRDSVGIFDPRTGGGISLGQHETIDSLVHNVAETSFTEYVRQFGLFGRIIEIIVWTNSGMTLRIRDEQISRVAGLVSQIIERQYDGAGLVIQTLTHTYNRVGSRLVSIDTVET